MSPSYPIPTQPSSYPPPPGLSRPQRQCPQGFPAMGVAGESTNLNTTPTVPGGHSPGSVTGDGEMTTSIEYKQLRVDAIEESPRVQVRKNGSPDAVSRYTEAYESRAVIPAMVVCAMHLFFVGSVRYRLPAMPMIEVLAAIGLVSIMDRYQLFTCRKNQPERIEL